MVILVITGFNETAGSVDIRTRLKYSNISSGTVSSRMDTVTVCVVEEGLYVKSRDVLEKSIPSALRSKITHCNLNKVAAYPVSMHERLLIDSCSCLWIGYIPHNHDLRLVVKLTNSCAIQGLQGYNDISGQNSIYHRYSNADTALILMNRIDCWIESNPNHCIKEGDYNPKWLYSNMPCSDGTTMSYHHYLQLWH